ncbi:MAG: amidohydrolase family protein [Gemmatimonadetes bacterium]|nr:amidohydrolase family protein [Gemmatimonadota bacterium]MDA1103490.1 amidohydrolase family protein [Gemmatimonadota bacterium]
MRLSTKDGLGLALVAGTFAAVIVHSEGDHRTTHLPNVADAGGAATSAQNSPTFAFVDFNVLPMDGRGLLRNQVVVVRNGFVDRIGAAGVIDVPPGATVVEGHGTQYLVPGLVDAHVHLADAREDVLPLFLANGVTTVFNLEGDARHLALRERSRGPGFVGPTLFTAGPFVHDGVVRSPEDARRVVTSQAHAGYDFVKVHGTLSEAAYIALTATAKEVGIAVVGHAPRNLPFSAVLQNGQVGVVHAEELIYTGLQSLDRGQATRTAREMAAAGTWLTPTLSNFANIAEQWASPQALADKLVQPEARHLPPTILRSWRDSRVYTGRPAHERTRIEEMYAFHIPLVQAMSEAGVRLLTGTDTPLPGMVPGFSLHSELAALEAAGIPTEDVLWAATANAGRFVRENVDPAALFGTIATGARADLLVVDGDPRADLSLLRQPLGVMARGTWYDRSQLMVLLSLASGVRTADEVTPR